MPFQNSSARTPRHRLILGGIMVVLVLLVVVIVLVAVFSSGRTETPGSGTLQWKGGGTTEHLQEIVLGRCYNYIATVNPELKAIDCFQIWQRLQNAFAYRDPCSMTEEDYQPLMDLASYFIPCNKSLFWSKTKDLVHRFTKANRDFLTLEDTLVGYIADELSWCGDLASPGINYQSCPKWSECKNNPSTIYWKMASKMDKQAAPKMSVLPQLPFITENMWLLVETRGTIQMNLHCWCNCWCNCIGCRNAAVKRICGTRRVRGCSKHALQHLCNTLHSYTSSYTSGFAEAACGTVQVMLNGSIETGAFRNDSFFGGIEVPNLNPDKVSMMHIWLTYDTDGPQSESCTGHSITTLKNILTSRKINVSCEENYRPVQLLQCTSDPDHSACRLCPYTTQ